MASDSTTHRLLAQIDNTPHILTNKNRRSNKPLTLQQQRQLARSPKTPLAIPKSTTLAVLHAPPSHLPYYVILRPATDERPGHYLVPEQEVVTVKGLRKRIRGLRKRVVRTKAPWGVGVSGLDVFVLLMEMRREMVAVRERAVAQVRAVGEEIVRREEHRARQEAEMRFSIAFGGLVWVDVLRSGYLERMAVPEYGNV